MSKETEAALGSTTVRILNALRQGPKLNTELSELSPTMHDHISFLRNAGIGVECQRVPDCGREGLFMYTVREDQPPPQWDIVVEVYLADGTRSHQQMQVSAWTQRQAKAKARNQAAKTHCTSSTLMKVVTGQEFTTPDEGH